MTGSTREAASINQFFGFSIKYLDLRLVFIDANFLRVESDVAIAGGCKSAFTVLLD